MATRRRLLADEQQRSLRELRNTAEHIFLEGLKGGVTPHVMGCLPDDVEDGRRKSMDASIPKKTVDAVVNKAWRSAYRRHRLRKR